MISGRNSGNYLEFMKLVGWTAILVMVIALATGCPTGGGGDEGEGEGAPPEGEGEGEGAPPEGEGEGAPPEGEGETEFKVGYVGSAACGACHADKYESFLLTGHPYKVNKVIDNEPPLYPYAWFGTKIDDENVPMPPIDGDGNQIGWDAVSYVIGGYGWKARFMDLEGYILTRYADDDAQGRTQNTQWNPPTPTATDRWVGYSHPSGDQAALGNPRKPYTCGKCHTTGWEAATEEQLADFENNQEAFQDGLPGIHGTWSEPGVHCEECHGPGAAHAASTLPEDIVVATTDAPDELGGKRCGECHTRDSQNRIAASGGAGSVFIRHHEQYDEMINGPHSVLSCVTCHDPHQPTRFAPELGLTKACTDCHEGKTVDRPSMASLDCIDCHMPAATKSGITYNARKGDVKTHIFAINPAAVGAEDDGGMFVNDPVDDALVVASPAMVTLDFACQGCHGHDGVSEKTLEELAAVAADIHLD